MFGQSKPVPFEPYGRRRSRGLLPRWLVLMLVGAAIGAGAVLYAQQRYLPPRLSADASARLRASFEQAEAERARLKGELADAQGRLERATADKSSLSTELSARTEAVERLRADTASLLASLPPDPRHSPVAVRAARFAAEAGTLTYDVVLSREQPGASPLGAVLQFVVAGASSRGAADTVTSKPIPISVDRYGSMHGGIPLPQGFAPRQATVQVLDKAGGKLLGMRVMNVK